jgi:hypothetical protein
MNLCSSCKNQKTINHRDTEKNKIFLDWKSGSACERNERLWRHPHGGKRAAVRLVEDHERFLAS